MPTEPVFSRDFNKKIKNPVPLIDFLRRIPSVSKRTRWEHVTGRLETMYQERMGPVQPGTPHQSRNEAWDYRHVAGEW